MFRKVFVKAALLGTMVCGLCITSLMAQQEATFHSTIIGSNPHLIVAGVQSGGAPWTVRHGSASLNGEGQLHVDLKNLILTQLGTTGPVTSVSASLVCGGAGGVVVATTNAVPISTDGNAELEAQISTSSPCFAPIVLIRAAAFNGTPLPQPGPWIAATGFTGIAADSNQDDK
ncbi:MAG TPA: hypothetical protein VKT33_01450 [Candidatus Angelobacter sp.]|nr:hypothetical protein [Candidatus Angelobacter sp.]